MIEFPELPDGMFFRLKKGGLLDRLELRKRLFWKFSYMVASRLIERSEMHPRGLVHRAECMVASMNNEKRINSLYGDYPPKKLSEV